MPLGNIYVVPHYVILTKWSDMSHITIKETNMAAVLSLIERNYL